ncbi:MAG: SpoIIE family protein phosphatase [Bacteroidota bacterium]
MASEQDNTLARQKLLLELNEKLLKQKKSMDAQLEELTIEKEHVESEKKKIEEKNTKLWEQSAAIHNEKERIDKLKQEVETRHREVMDSISYAERIQNAILPLQKEINAALPQCFVYFQPKDIVSGDFYWFNNKDEKIFIAAVDCTGHGVPGAFMSMVGHIVLDEIVMQKGFTDPGNILNELDNKVRLVLRQDNQENSTRDGMDICLCVINKQTKSLEYAGANRPLWIIGSDKQLSEIKATKTAIGGLREEPVTFQTHTINYNEGDNFYLFSDGYADQFSSNDKKLMSKRFKETLLSVQEKTMQEQGIYMKEFLTNWKGSMEQTDDVLVIGFRL